MTIVTTPKINNPQNFKSSNTLATTRKPHYATKVDTAFNIVPGMHRPNANNMPSNITQNDFIGPDFKARPLKHWRRQLIPTNATSDNSTQKRMSTVNFMDTPGLTVYKTNADTCKCVNNAHNAFEITNSYNKNNFRNVTQNKKIQNNGQIDVPTFYISAPIIEEIYNDIPGTALIIEIEYENDLPTIPDIVDIEPITPFHENPVPDPDPDPDPNANTDNNYNIYTSVYNTVCIACNPEQNIIKSGISTLSQAYYGSTSQYLESRCRTYHQRESTTKIPDGIYYPSKINIPFVFLYPNDDVRGPQVYQPKNCANPKIYNNTLSTPPNSYCSTIYKPNNPQFACQGAVSGSTRIQKLKSNTITSNGFSLYSAYGATMANAGNFQGTNESNNYYVKNRNYPLTGYNSLDKYRQNKLSGCCTSSV